MKIVPSLLFFTLLVDIRGEMVDVWKLPLELVTDSEYLEFKTEEIEVKEFSTCFYFKPKFMYNRNYSVLIYIEDALTVGIFKESGSGWVDIGSEYLEFDFGKPLFPRTWYSMCVQAGRGKRKVWHENQTLYDKTPGTFFNLRFKVLLTFKEKCECVCY